MSAVTNGKEGSEEYGSGHHRRHVLGSESPRLGFVVPYRAQGACSFGRPTNSLEDDPAL